MEVVDKIITINFEDIITGAFTILMANEKELKLSYGKLKEYEEGVTNYYEKQKYVVNLNTSIEDLEQFLLEMEEFSFVDENFYLNEEIFMAKKHKKRGFEFAGLFSEEAYYVFDEESKQFGLKRA